MAKGTERPRSYLLYEKREEEMVSPKDGKQTRRVARFLKPFVADLTKAARFSNTPMLFEVFSPTLQQWPSKVNLNWRMPQKKWEEWIDRLAGKYCSIWNQAGICEAIMSSKYEVRCNKDIILGLAEFWSSETNTFLFPWGEATVTLEDLMVLGGFPVLGRPVTTPVIGSMVEMVGEMEKKRVEMCRNTKAKKACHWNWLRHFIEQKECNHEHVAFLSLWLSRFVFPSLPEESIGKHVFPIAAHLSQGTRVALAPAVLAGLYKDLTFLKQQTLCCIEEISVAGPFQLLQLWALERFQNILQAPPNALKPGEPRAARWHKVSSRINLPLVRSVVQLAGNFQWRPYAAALSNWCHSSYYKEEKIRFVDSTNFSDENLQSYVKCLRALELVGVGGGKEKYLPHRVAMQFGMDQDLPCEFPCSDFGSGTSNVSFFIPPWSFEPSVTEMYFCWWRKSKLARADAIKDDVMVLSKKIKEKCDASMADKNLEMYKASPQAFTKGEAEKKRSNVMPKVPRKSSSTPSTVNRTPSSTVKSTPSTVNKTPSSTVKRPPSAATTCPKQVKKVSSPDDSDDDHIPLSKRMRPLEKRPAEGSPAKTKIAGDFAEKLGHIENVKSKCTFRMEHEHKMGAEVSEKGYAEQVTEAMAEGSSLNNPMEADKERQCKDVAVEDIKKTIPVGFLKNPAEVDDHIENATSKTSSIGLLIRVEKLESIIGVNPV